MRLSRPLFAAALSSLLLSLAPAAARAGDDSDQARQMADEADKALAQHHYQAAAEKFRRAEVLSHSPVYMLGLARALAGLNRVVAAHDAYSQVAQDGPAKDATEQRAVEDARKEDADVASRIARVTVTVLGPPTPYVLLDDLPVAGVDLGSKHAVDPGTHALRATARGYAPAEATFTVAEGGEVTAVLAMSPAEGLEEGRSPGATAATPGSGPATAMAAPGAAGPVQAEAGLSGYRIGAYASFGVAAIGLVVGIGEGLRASSIKSDLSTSCAPNCTQAEVDRAQTALDISSAGYIIGVAGVAAGIALILFEPKSQARAGATVAPYVGPGTVGAVGRF